MRLLDLFSGGGGCSEGYHRAGFEVVGVDRAPQPAYPFEFVQADAHDYLAEHGHLFDVIHASPPCQEPTRARHLREAQGGTVKEHGLNLIPLTRALLKAIGRPYVIENVEDALPHLVNPVRLCGSAFGLRVRRHRLFESNIFLFGVECDHPGQGRPIGVYGRPGDDIPEGGSTARNLAEAQTAMGIDWIPRWDSLKEAVPPAYTHYLGDQLATHLQAVA